MIHPHSRPTSRRVLGRASTCMGQSEWVCGDARGRRAAAQPSHGASTIRTRSARPSPPWSCANKASGGRMSLLQICKTLPSPRHTARQTELPGATGIPCRSTTDTKMQVPNSLVHLNILPRFSGPGMRTLSYASRLHALLAPPRVWAGHAEARHVGGKRHSSKGRGSGRGCVVRPQGAGPAARRRSPRCLVSRRFHHHWEG